MNKKIKLEERIERLEERLDLLERRFPIFNGRPSEDGTIKGASGGKQ